WVTTPTRTRNHKPRRSALARTGRDRGPPGLTGPHPRGASGVSARHQRLGPNSAERSTEGTRRSGAQGAAGAACLSYSASGAKMSRLFFAFNVQKHARRCLTPDLSRRLDDEAELGDLVVDGERIALDGR